MVITGDLTKGRAAAVTTARAPGRSPGEAALTEVVEPVHLAQRLGEPQDLDVVHVV